MVEQREQYFNDGVLTDLDFTLDAAQLRLEHHFISMLALRGSYGAIAVKVDVDREHPFALHFAFMNQIEQRVVYAHSQTLVQFVIAAP